MHPSPRSRWHFIRDLRERRECRAKQSHYYSKAAFSQGEGDGSSMEQKSIIPKVYTHIFCVSHPNGFAIDHYCGRAFLHLILLLARQASVLCTLSMHYKQRLLTILHCKYLVMVCTGFSCDPFPTVLWLIFLLGFKL